MADTRSLMFVWEWLAATDTKLGHLCRVLSRGFMIGTAILLPVVTQYENSFYRFLVSCIFMVATFAHFAFNWEGVKRYALFALATMFLSGLATVPFSKASVPLLLDRLPILIMMTGLWIEEIPRLFKRLMTDPRFVPPDVGSEPDRDPVLPTLDHDKELFAHMDGAEREQFNTLSQVSSDISLSHVGSGKLPSSCDTMTRAFWPDLLDRSDKRRESDGDEDEG
ncbi:uncharacterized protein GGS22DRAFT_17701 [Annulohypoxylon maeteangense]|uniref:uncharacterized protein n=1 Tax=Annulohypoxylon maeteangense TaxID=1927788 RepID=UPI0020082F40|nr:uncharacterized protein GGS22DRAFT_17701 [Annulohypoxylon maeteangense]KAI0890724.1 hypothetical protein GGS22DRAFT_17701 [Annulohypoxylon maeteangense]